MSRWGKNIVVPLDSLCKEKDRPTVARSVGTVGKWGKMGFTSTRTYSLSSLPAAVAAAAAAAASPAQSPASALEDDMSPSVPEPPKPKKFFKSRNTAPPEVIAQIIHHFPRASTSPLGGDNGSMSSLANMPVVASREPIKLKLLKPGDKKKSPKKATKSRKSTELDGSTADVEGSYDNIAPLPAPSVKPEQKQKKKKEEKQLKPEAPPSRVTSRARKTVNYCEVDEDERSISSSKGIVQSRERMAQEAASQGSTTAAPEPVLPPPALPFYASGSSTPVATHAASSKTPEHPPIVLRISKGTSRLVSTDSEDQANNTTASPLHDSALHPAASTEEVPAIAATVASDPSAITASCIAPKIIVKPPKPSPPTAQAPPGPLLNENNEINYCTVKISPDKPPKERLKLIIKTDVIRNAIAAAAAAAAAKSNNTCANSATGLTDRQEREKKSKSKRHKQKHASAEQLLTPAQVVAAADSEFKTPSPHLALDQQQGPLPHQLVSNPRTVISPPALSERDFDSQSSVLGSISSKGNSTPSQPLAQAVQEESCVIHSRGSSVITSDLETSQHSSLVAPPSDIESRLESMMMMDGDVSQRPTMLAEEEPMQEDILAVLRGDESMSVGGVAHLQLNGAVTAAEATIDEHHQHLHKSKDDDELPSIAQRRVTRGCSNRAKPQYADGEEVMSPQTPAPVKTPPSTRIRGRKQINSAASVNPSGPPEEVSPPAAKRTTRRTGKKDDPIVSSETMDTEDSPAKPSPSKSSPTKTSPSKLTRSKTPEAVTANEPPNSPPATRRPRSTRNSIMNTTTTNNNITNNNNNINKIAANLTAKAGAAEVAANASAAPAIAAAAAAVATVATTTTASSEAVPPATITAQTAAAPTPGGRSYGRKRKNQQVVQVLQPTSEELEEQQATPAKVAAITSPAARLIETDMTAISACDRSLASSPDLHEANSNSDSCSHGLHKHSSPASPPAPDYKVKDKFKRTLTLDNQANCNAVCAPSPNSAEAAEAGSGMAVSNGCDEDSQRVSGSMKLVISKKKGSIFKSRALAPAEQAEQTTVSKRHLYKHSWDAAEENGGHAEDDAAATAVNDAEASAVAARTAPVGSVFDDDDFGDEPISVGGRDTAAVAVTTSPALGKFTRVIKPNPQAVPCLDGDAVAGAAAPGETISTVKVDRRAKGYYTVVRNVKTAHQIQEIGEYQEMDDDVEYILDALQPHNPTPTRCLSALQLATKCMTAAFRMHVRAHGVVTKFFKALSDANRDLSLGLCTSAIMYILSQEGLNMDLDRDSLELMMNLLESEGVAAPSDRANYERNRQKVRELCEEIKAQGKATHLNVDSITVGTLAMETLLSLTSKRAGDWFKEELRELGGLEHIVKTISDCCRPVLECSQSASGGATARESPTDMGPIDWTAPLLENMQTAARCMRVLENVTQMNEENQKYMLTYGTGTAVRTLCTLYALCDRELVVHPTDEASSKENPGVVLRELLTPLMKVLINLTHTFNPDSAIGAELLGQRPEVIEVSFHLLLDAPNYIPDRCVFELSILVLLLLINLSMYTVPNRVYIVASKGGFALSENHDRKSKTYAVQALMEYFYKCEELARLVEKNTDAILDNTDKNKKKQEEVDETVNNLLQKAGHHMEHTLKGSYAAILIGHLISDSEQHETLVRQHVRGQGFKELVSVLEKYYTFMNLTASSEAAVVAHIKSTKKLIDYFKKRDLVNEMNKSSDCVLPLNLETTHHHHRDNTVKSSSSIPSNPASTHQNSVQLNSLATAAPTSVSTTSGSTTAAARNAAPRVYKTYSSR